MNKKEPKQIDWEKIENLLEQLRRDIEHLNELNERDGVDISHDNGVDISYDPEGGRMAMECSMCGKYSSYRPCGMCSRCEQVCNS